jgi:hypothetical protein
MGVVLTLDSKTTTFGITRNKIAVNLIGLGDLVVITRITGHLLVGAIIHDTSVLSCIQTWQHVKVVICHC